MAGSPARCHTLGMDDPAREEPEAGDLPVREAPAPTLPKVRRQTLRDTVLDPWSTTRGGDPLAELEGWGLGLDDPTVTFSHPYSDLVALRQQLRAIPAADRPPEWKLSHIAPWIPPERRSYWDPTTLPTSPFMAARMKATAAAKEAFLRYAATGLRVAAIFDKPDVNISLHTYTRWRREDAAWKDRLDRIRAGLEDDHTFHDKDIVSRRRYFFGFDTYPHQELIIDAINNAPAGGITLILLPPEAMKTQTVSDILALSIADDPSLRILYVSEKAGDGSMGQKVLADMKARFTDPHYEDPAATDARIQEFQARYGPFRDEVMDKDKPWNANYIKVHKAPAYRDFTFQVAGWRSRILGNRVDKLVFDDVQSGESMGQTEQMLNRIRQTFLTRPGKTGQTIFIGNRIGVGDLYERMIEEGMIDELVIIPALDEEGHSYCEQAWPVEALAQRRQKVGEDIWQRTYMMAPQLAEEATYTQELIDNCRIPISCGPNALEGLGGDARVVCGLDPALGGGNALVVAAFTQSTFRVIDLQLDYRLARNEDIFDRVREMSRYRFSHLVVEINSQQKGLARDDRLHELADKMGFEVVEHQTTASGKWDPSWGVRSMAGSFIRKEVQIPSGDDSTDQRLKPLVDQLLQWRPNISPKLQRQDAVMAFWFAWLYWQREREAFGFNTDQWQTTGTPWKPGDMSGRWGSGRRGRRLAGV